MNKKSTLGVFVGVLFLFATFTVSAPVAHAASLTEPQIQAILGLLRAFDVPAATVTNVDGILHGKPSTTGTKSQVASFTDFLKGTTFENLARGVDGDILDGGDGIDTISYSKVRSHYTLVRGHDVPEQSLLNAVLVYDNDDGSIDVVVNAELMTFADQTITLPTFTKVQ